MTFFLTYAVTSIMYIKAIVFTRMELSSAKVENLLYSGIIKNNFDLSYGSGLIKKCIKIMTESKESY